MAENPPSPNPSIVAQKQFQMLVANLSSGTYPDLGATGIQLSDVMIRNGFTRQQVMRKGKGTSDVGRFRELTTVVDRSGGTGPTAATASLEVDDNDFSGGAIIIVGPFTLVSGIDFVPGADTTATASNIATAISRLPVYSAVNAVAVVNVTGRKGIQGNFDRFEAQSYGIVDNFISITGFANGEPALEGPAISP